MYFHHVVEGRGGTGMSKRHREGEFVDRAGDARKDIVEHVPGINSADMEIHAQRHLELELPYLRLHKECTQALPECSLLNLVGIKFYHRPSPNSKPTTQLHHTVLPLPHSIHLPKQPIHFHLYLVQLFPHSKTHFPRLVSLLQPKVQLEFFVLDLYLFLSDILHLFDYCFCLVVHRDGVT